MRIFKFVTVKRFSTVLLMLFLLYTAYNSFSYLLEEGEDVVELVEEEESEEESAEEYELQFEEEEHWNHLFSETSTSRYFFDFYSEIYEDVVISGTPQPPELVI